MTNFIPIFPLDIVVYPGEKLNLHIFEPRYKQMIRECIDEKKPFGITSVFMNQMQDLGTLMEITEMVQEYDNGEMDVRTKGIQVFRVLEVVKEIPEKLYSGAIVNYPENTMEREANEVSKLIAGEVRRLYKLLSQEEKLGNEDEVLESYKIAHFLGMSRDQEYELLNLFTEVQRLEFIRRHLTAILPIVKELEFLKMRIQQNGHFKHLSLSDFNL